MRYGKLKRLSVRPVTPDGLTARPEARNAVLIRLRGCQPALLTEEEAMAFTDEIRAMVFQRRSARR